MVSATDIQPPDAPQTLNLSRAWLNVVRRIQSIARHQEGIALIKLIVMVDSNGEPQVWTAPSMTLLEPKLRAEELMKKLSDDQLGRILQALGEE